MKYIKLPIGETDERKVYRMPDPDDLQDSIDAIYRWRYYSGPEPTTEQFTAAYIAAASYIALTTCFLGQEHCVRKLRDIWRARRDRRKDGE